MLAIPEGQKLILLSMLAKRSSQSSFDSQISRWPAWGFSLCRAPWAIPLVLFIICGRHEGEKLKVSVQRLTFFMSTDMAANPPYREDAFSPSHRTVFPTLLSLPPHPLASTTVNSHLFVLIDVRRGNLWVVWSLRPFFFSSSKEREILARPTRDPKSWREPATVECTAHGILTSPPLAQSFLLSNKASHLSFTSTASSKLPWASYWAV